MRIQPVVVTYGDLINPVSPSLQSWWNETETRATELNVALNEVSGGFRQKPRGLVSHNSYKLARYRSRFVQQLEAGNVEYLDFMRRWPEGGYRTSDWDFCGLYGLDPSAGAVFTVGIDLGRIRSITAASPRGFCQEAVHRSSQYLNAKYGLAVSMPKFFMPGGYAIGLAAEVPEEMIADCNAWSRFSGKECDRTLRNVYGFNVLMPDIWISP